MSFQRMILIIKKFKKFCTSITCQFYDNTSEIQQLTVIALEQQVNVMTQKSVKEKLQSMRLSQPSWNCAQILSKYLNNYPNAL